MRVEPTSALPRSARDTARAAAANQPLLGLLSTLYRSGFLGVCEVMAGRAHAKLFLRDGQIVHASMPDRADALGHVLYDMGNIDLQTYRETMRQARDEGVRHGVILLGLKIIDQLRLDHALGVQLARKLHRIFALEGARYIPRLEEHPFGTEASSLPMLPSPRHVIFLAARTAAQRNLDNLIAPLAGHVGHIAPEHRERLDRFGFGETGLAVATRLLTGPTDFDRILAQPSTRGEAAAALTALLMTGLVELEQEGEARAPAKVGRTTRELGPTETDDDPWQPGPITRAAAALATPRAPRSAAAQETADELRTRLDGLDAKNLFEVLGVRQDATEELVRAAYSVLARRFHPDRVTALGLGELGSEADRHFQRLAEARNTLCDPRSRVRYQGLLERGRLTGRLEPLLAAERFFQRGEQLLLRGDFGGAAEQFDAAAAKNGDEPDYMAAMLWARYLQHHDGQLGRVALAVMQAKRGLWNVIVRWPENVRAYLYIARVLAEVGEREKAVAALRKALFIDPLHEEVRRELAIQERRHAAGGDIKGLLGRGRKG
jgi:tetratricopeptide (TPR) repeat protein